MITSIINAIKRLTGTAEKPFVLTKENFREEWVKALRSGEFTQGRGKLADGGGNFCCLGVLCQLTDIPRKFDSSLGTTYGKHNVAATLPSELQERFGISDNPIIKFTKANVEILREYGVSVDRHTWLSLAELNDEGVPFSVIADLIEEHIK